MRGALATVAAVLVLAGCDPTTVDKQDALPKGTDIVAREGPLPLSAEEVRIYLGDSTLSYESENRRWHIYLRKDGSMTGVATALKAREQYERVNGRWFVLESGQLCREWNGDWGGAEIDCAQVYREGNTYLFVVNTADGVVEHRRNRRGGNPEQL